MQKHPSFDDAASNCLLFLANYKDPYDEVKTPKYVQQLQEIANRQRKVLKISLDDVEAFFLEEQQFLPSFIHEIESNSRRYLKLFAAAADKAMPSPTAYNFKQDVFDVLSQHRAQMDAQQQPQTGAMGATGPGAVRGCPDVLLRRFDTYLVPRGKAPCMKMRGVSAQQIGRLVKVRGVVTHITDVKPLVSVVAYTDPASGYEIYQEVTGRTFKPLDQDPAEMRKVNRRVLPVMETRGSKFVKFQEARIQEMADEVPEGATPRTMSVHLRGEITRSMKPGDEVTLTGIFLPEPYTGFRAMRAGLLMTTYIDAQDVVQAKRQYGANFELTPAEQLQVQELCDGGGAFERLARSIAPEIYGMEDVKKVLLLLMVGGVTRTFPDGLKLRGDIHGCLMGDPGVAKSQLLKYISRISPRAVYTTGKGSSGVGLTAAVLRNPTTKELVLEGGALVLADKGICCIDEFDKMEEGDRTAIHEVMEQQTVSIAKAGITTTLNTRTTLLAAANPAFGRYDRKRSPTENINLPAALLSRFDILWLLLDEANPELDRTLAEHVMQVHLTGKPPVRAADENDEPLVPQRLLRAYIGKAKSFQPTVPEELTEYVANIYAEMRQMEVAAQGNTATYTTPRTLLSILRLSQAVAKLRFSDVVTQPDMDEALRLMQESKGSLQSAPEHDSRGSEDAIDIIYRLLREHSNRTKEYEIPYATIVQLTQRYNVTRDDINECVEEYARIALWTVERDQEGNPVVHIPTPDVE